MLPVFILPILHNIKNIQICTKNMIIKRLVPFWDIGFPIIYYTFTKNEDHLEESLMFCSLVCKKFKNFDQYGPLSKSLRNYSTDNSQSSKSRISDRVVLYIFIKKSLYTLDPWPKVQWLRWIQKNWINV